MEKEWEDDVFGGSALQMTTLNKNENKLFER